jgi:hypothetical protein
MDQIGKVSRGAVVVIFSVDSVYVPSATAVVAKVNVVVVATDAIRYVPFKSESTVAPVTTTLSFTASPWAAPVVAVATLVATAIEVRELSLRAKVVVGWIDRALQT